MRGKKIRPGKAVSELELLREIRARALQGVRNGSLRLGIGDDCALLGVRPDEELAVTTDLSIAGRHFRLDWHPPESVGHRTLARGLSDLGSMGARPVAAFLSLGVPRDLTVRRGRRSSWIDRFYAGLFRLADAYKTPLAGGDLAESPVAVADIVLVGAVPKGKALRRSEARAGDILFVTGSLGGSAAGLARLSRLERKAGSRLWTSPARVPEDLAAHLFPQPRVAQGLALRRRGLANAAIDLSDGISTDLAHLCEESRVSAVIEKDALPLGIAASLEQALHGGEDYELLFSARPSVRVPKSIAGVPITRIGRVTAPDRNSPTVLLDTGSGTMPVEPHGWQHFVRSSRW